MVYNICAKEKKLKIIVNGLLTVQGGEILWNNCDYP